MSGVIDDEWYGVARNGPYSKVGKSGFSWWDAAGNEKKDCGPMYKSIHYWMSYEKKQGGRKYYFGPGDLAIFSSSPGATEEVEVCCAVVKNGRSPMVLGKPNEDGQPGALGEYEMGGFVGLRKPDSRKELVEWEAMLHEYLEKERSRIDAEKVAASDHNGGEDGNHSGRSRDMLDSDDQAFLDAWKPKDMKRKSVSVNLKETTRKNAHTGGTQSKMAKKKKKPKKRSRSPSSGKDGSVLVGRESDSHGTGGGGTEELAISPLLAALGKAQNPTSTSNSQTTYNINIIVAPDQVGALLQKVGAMSGPMAEIVTKKEKK